MFFGCFSAAVAASRSHALVREARQLFETLVATSLRDAKLSEKEELQAALSAAVADGRLSEADAQLSDEEDEDLSDKLDLARFGIFTGKGGAAADDDDASDDASSMSEALAAGEKSANRVFEDLDESEQVCRRASFASHWTRRSRGAPNARRSARAALRRARARAVVV